MSSFIVVYSVVLEKPSWMNDWVSGICFDFYIQDEGLTFCKKAYLYSGSLFAKLVKFR